MDKITWLSLSAVDRAYELKRVLKKIVEIDKIETTVTKERAMKPHDEKFKLEQQVLEYLDWEKEDNEVD